MGYWLGKSTSSGRLIIHDWIMWLQGDRIEPFKEPLSFFSELLAHLKIYSKYMNPLMYLNNQIQDKIWMSKQ